MGVIPRQRDSQFPVWDEADKRGLKPSDWGSADPTGLEERTVQSSTKWDDAGAGDEEGWSDTDRGLYPLDWRMPESVSFGDFAEAAYKHACVVANHIYEKGGDARIPFVWLSYVLKNTADRYIRHILHSQPDFEEGEGRDFWEEYYLSTDRAKRHKNGAVRYPKDIDRKKIHGVGALHRYWPAQLLRNLELIRLRGQILHLEMSEPEDELLQMSSTDGIYPTSSIHLPDSVKYAMLSPINLRKLGLDGVGARELRKYWLDWDEPWLREALSADQVETKYDVPVNIALKVIEVLRERSVADIKIAQLLVASYDPGGAIWEHGETSESWIIWHTLLSSSRLDKEMKELLVGQLLSEDVLSRIENDDTKEEYKRSFQGSWMFGGNLNG